MVSTDSIIRRFHIVPAEGSNGQSLIIFLHVSKILPMLQFSKKFSKEETAKVSGSKNAATHGHDVCSTQECMEIHLE